MAARFSDKNQQTKSEQDRQHVPTREPTFALLDGNRDGPAHRWRLGLLALWSDGARRAQTNRSSLEEPIRPINAARRWTA